ncbi:MAG: FecR family protein, partial [Deltaproteobacteria bacterium]|nr:FecR family protein [Deltaproteobacteria bacterium]
MKRSLIVKAGLLAGLLLVIAVQVHAADPDTLYVRHIEGGVELAEAGSSQWMGAAVNTPLIEGDTIRTAASGKAELFLKDGSLVRIGSASTMKIVSVEQNGVQIKLERGMGYIVAKGSKEVPIFFDTPSAALDITVPATVRVDAYDGGISEISVYNGEVYAARQNGRMPVRAGERLVLKMDGSAPLLAGLRAGDEWQRWNNDRDRAVLANSGTSESYAYLPDELRTYSSDFDANGQWVYTPEYNYVWVPTVITVSTWSPYRFGSWVWIRGSYVWVGYEPWGWAPYHYGTWTHHRTAGWCWVPPARGRVRWEPAQVAWVHSSSRVGWVPLAPGETYDRRKAPVIHQTNVYTV